MKTTKEIADSVRDSEYLQNKGWRKVPCDNPNCIEHSIKGPKCFSCDGKGFRWEAPLT